MTRHKYPKRYVRPIDTRDYIERDCGYESPCWVWTHTVFPDGYARIWTGSKPSRIAHRVMYEQTHGEAVPRSIALHHRCRVKLCIRPDHLEPMTHSEHASMSHPTYNATRPALYALVDLHESREALKALRARLAEST